MSEAMEIMMAEKAIDTNEDDTLELTEIVDDEPDADEADGDAVEGGDDPDGEGGEEETIVSFGDDDADQEGDSSVIRRLRERLRTAEREKAELRRAVPEQQAIEVGEKPTLAGCEYDEEAFETSLDEWKQRKAEAEGQQSKADEANRAANEAWAQDLAVYNEKKQAIGLTDYDEIEAHVVSVLNQVQQAVVIKAAADPALFVAAIGRSDAKLAELAKIQDPIKLAVAIARMEGSIKVEKKRKGPAIDTPQRGSAAMPGGADKQLEKMEKDAARTGDRTKLIAYKKTLEVKGKK